MIALMGISCSPSVVPDDFRIIVRTGAMHPAWGASEVQIDAAGRGLFRSWSTQALFPKAVDSLDFVVSKEAVARVWAAVEQNGIFHLQSRHSDGKMQDGGYIYVFVIARGDTQGVRDEQVSVRPMARILETVNQVVPKRARQIGLD